jgi:hypothetical protein
MEIKVTNLYMFQCIYSRMPPLYKYGDYRVLNYNTLITCSLVLSKFRLSESHTKHSEPDLLHPMTGRNGDNYTVGSVTGYYWTQIQFP